MAPSPHEEWRLRDARGHLAICQVTAETREYRLLITVDGDITVSENHRHLIDASKSAEAHRRRLVADGWTGDFSPM